MACFKATRVRYASKAILSIAGVFVSQYLKHRRAGYTALNKVNTAFQKRGFEMSFTASFSFALRIKSLNFFWAIVASSECLKRSIRIIEYNQLAILVVAPLHSPIFFPLLSTVD